MLKGIQLLGGALLIWYSFTPLQNPVYPVCLASAAAAGWLIAFGLTRRKALFNSTLWFHFCILFAFHLRAIVADGHRADWFLWLAISEWLVVLWLALKHPEDPLAPSIFLAIALISPLYFKILHARDDSSWGLPIWILLMLRLYVAIPKKQIPKMLLLFLLLCGVSIFFSVYRWRNMQFLALNAACVAVYIGISSSDKKVAVLAGYAHQSLALILFAVLNLKLLVAHLGAAALQMRLWIVMYHNDLVPNFLAASAILFYFVPRTQQRKLKTVLLILCMLLASLMFLTYSRNGWISYLLLLSLSAAFSNWTRQKKILAIGGAAGLLILLIVLGPFRAREQFQAQTEERFYHAQMGWKLIQKHPTFGVGWFNTYAQTSLAKPAHDLDGLHFAQNLLPYETHSFILDLSQAVGLPAVILFLILVVEHVFRALRNGAILAGLVCYTISSWFDSAAFLPTSYPHYWVLLAMAASAEVNVRKTRVASTVLITILLFGSVFPLLEDRELLLEKFRSRNRELVSSLTHFLRARKFNPFDTLPLDQIRVTNLALEQFKIATYNLQKVSHMKKDFAPYHAQLGALTQSVDSLNHAKALDPYNALRSGTYVELAKRAPERYLMLSFLYLRPADDTCLQSIDPDSTVQLVEFADSKARDNRDYLAATFNAYENFVRCNRHDLAQIVLEGILRRPNRLTQGERHYTLNLLAASYMNAGKIDRLKVLEQTPEVRARLLLAEGRPQGVPDLLQQSLKYVSPPDFADAWELYYIRGGQPDRLREQYNFLLNYPAWSVDPAWQKKIAESYRDEKQYEQAAKAYAKLSMLDRTDPVPRCWETRMWALAGKSGKTSTQRIPGCKEAELFSN